MPVTLKGLSHADLAKKDFLHEFVLFYVRLLCSINFCFGPVEMRQFKNNCSGLKIDWGSPPGCSYLRNAYYVITFCCFTQIFVDSTCKQLTMALSQARNLFRRNNLSGDFSDYCVNNLHLSMNKSPNCAMCTSLQWMRPVAAVY